MHRPERGVWIVSNGPLDDPADARSRFVADYLTGMEDGLDQWLPRTETLLAHHATQGSPDVCLHRGEYGTVSSTTVALTGSPEGAVFRYTPGPPCQSETIDFSPALQKLLSDRRED
ncbi:MAG: hypothetical protein CMJ48_11820 [Planctomycetaceae bacterium]|nr:hypothetical protein [Planctomycetaceae bacterium]